MTESKRTRVHLNPQSKADVLRLKEKAEKNPGSRDEALYEAVIVMIDRLDGRRGPTKRLDYHSDFADLSDCDTTYVGADPNEKPPLRIVSTDTPSPDHGVEVDRDIIVIGPRANDMVYRSAGQRLDRQRGVSLAESTQQPSADYQVERERFETTYDCLLDVVDSWNPDSPAMKKKIDGWSKTLLVIDERVKDIDEIVPTNSLVAQRRITELNKKMDSSLLHLDPQRTSSSSLVGRRTTHLPQFDHQDIDDYQPGS